MRNFIHVNNYVLKAEHTPDLDEVVVAKLRAAAALVFLDQKEYAKVRRLKRGEGSMGRTTRSNGLERDVVRSYPVLVFYSIFFCHTLVVFTCLSS